MIQAETLELLEWGRLCQHLGTFAATKLGASAARNLYPPATRTESLTLLEQTKEVYTLELNLTTGLSFEGIEDVGESLQRAELGGMLTGRELLDIATTLAGMRRLRRTIEEDDNSPTLKDLVAHIRTYPELEQQIHHCIDDRGAVTDRASPQLTEIRARLKNLRQKIQEILQHLIQRHNNALQQAIITQRSDRYVLAVKAPQKDVIPGIVHDTSGSGSTLYIEPQAIIDLGNKLRQTQRQEKTEEEVILRKLTAIVAEVKADLEHLVNVATALDLATAKARYSLWLEANPPHFLEPTLLSGDEGDRYITLHQVRHPLLVWQNKHEQGNEVVPLDLKIAPKIKVVAITGPNTGGKTVTLKTLGLIALMAKVGLFIPAREPVELPWFSQVLADIGDEQSLQQSLSTFSGHIRRISRILEAVDADSLVLLDEVGAGTDPAEGSALAIALLYYLADVTRLTLATTHYGELKALKYQDDRFENASVEFDDVNLTPTYRLLWGIPGRSNALTIAQRLGLKREVIENAKTLVGGFSEEVNQVIAGLESQRRQQEQKAKEAAKLLAEAEQFYQEVSDRATALQAREKDLQLSQERIVTEAILAAKGEIAAVIRELQQQPKTGQNTQKATNALQSIADRHLPKVPKKVQTYYPNVGERIRLPRLAQTAEVLSIAEDKETLTVRFGLMKMTVSLAEIESLDGKTVVLEKKAKEKKAKAQTQVKQEEKSESSPFIPTVRTSQNTVDVRGTRVFQAESELEGAIATATNSGILWIIHGKGTGRLRQGIHEFLQRHPQVDKFELASEKEGGAGVTLVYLK